MATTKSRRHTHKYHKVTTGMGEIWACALPDCNHHMPSHMTELVTGKASICWGCGDPFILTKQNMREKQPKCDDCDATAIAIRQVEKDQRKTIDETLGLTDEDSQLG